VYGEAFDTHATEIQAVAHVRAWAEQVLIALVLKVLTDKLAELMHGVLESLGLAGLNTAMQTSLVSLRDLVADLAVPDRTSFVNVAVTFWSRLVSIFRFGNLPANPQAYEVLSPYVPAAVKGDANAIAAGIGRLGLILASLVNGKTSGAWELDVPADANVASGAITARANRPGATYRPLFIVKSATEAIALQKIGAFAANNAVVIHGDETWQALIGKKRSARQPRSAPGRTGSIDTTHVSFGLLLSRVTDALALQHQFAEEMML
jgi:hypothetical protein